MHQRATSQSWIQSPATYAHDRTSGTPVRNFFHNTQQYRLAVSHNATLDRDKDGIACEKA